jgi:hypothetical protein
MLTPVRIYSGDKSRSVRGEWRNSPKMTTLFAPTRFNPVPPASVEIKKIHVSGFLWNRSIMGMPGMGDRSVN